MKLYVVAKTSIKDLVIDFIEIVNEKGQTISLNWEESSVERVKDGFTGCYQNVVSEEGKTLSISDVSEMRVVHVELYSAIKKRLDIDIIEMGFVEENSPSAFVVEDCYFTKNQQKTVKFLNALEDMLKKWISQHQYDIDSYFSQEDVSEISGLFDIAYDFKSDFENSKLNPYSKNERTRLMYADEFDRWYDCLIVESIIPFLRRIAYQNKEGQDE